MIIAIDGPAGAGKSTTARALAERLHFHYIDTGAMYRALAWAAREKQLQLNEEARLAEMASTLPLQFHDNGQRLSVDGHDVSAEIRTPEIGELTSVLSALPEVRAAMVAQQRRLGRAGEVQTGGAVLEGRDIQTVVFPDAEVKIFLTADVNTRAGRRFSQWEEKVSAQDAENDIRGRDERDSTRAASPLCAADDALILETDQLSPKQVVERIVQIVQAKRQP